ncbi:hypothetical protein NS506_00430 [Nocardia seriolae]|uniref:Uncharacterized protein n=2 Tax=Nocardia seriolae TaxID=37332 RepID=A0ABC9Z5F1_9NOCA|nr:hypothetical protein NS506_00430 [Nocardia seriolae]GEM28676.1 hypothetical protein NS2_69150 [Nocardia seriolae NBRC 15557]OJF83716.1 hypothetical protein NS14008_37190 [Nocardia seriolae]PSK27024.1 hypothetical protein C6575_34125 [Nocardia seriolae]RLP24115.1 hypothetical protein D6158_34125 [Nocardia seriolae]
MSVAALTAEVRELSALAEQMVEIVRPYVGAGLVLEVATRAESADSIAYRDTVRSWRSPVRLLLISIPDGDAGADNAYDDWVHWIAGGGLLAVGNQRLYARAMASGKFRELPTTGAIRILQRIAACN